MSTPDERDEPIPTSTDDLPDGDDADEAADAGTRTEHEPGHTGEPRYERITSGSFEPERHFYPRVLNAQLHSLVRFFLNLDNARIINRYCHLNPRVHPEVLGAILDRLQPPLPR